jgi:IS5 family transposase
MVGLLLLKQLENLSDERVVLQFKRNPYYQYFCGYSIFKQNDQEIRGILAKVG